MVTTSGCAARTTLPRFGDPRVLFARGAELHVVWEIDDAPSLWSPATTGSATLARYLDDVRARIDPDPIRLLERQVAFYATDAATRDESTNGAWVLANRARVIERASAFDLSLFAFQAERFPMLDRPSEIGAFVVARDGRLRVYASSTDRAGQKIRGVVTDAIEADTKRGFTFRTLFHNHNFFFDKPDIGGGVAPSATDVQLFRSFRADLGLAGARVTNGFHTAVIDARDFDALAARSR